MDWRTPDARGAQRHRTIRGPAQSRPRSGSIDLLEELGPGSARRLCRRLSGTRGCGRHLCENVMYGRPPLGKDFFIVSASGSGAVMYPACLRGAWTAGPEGVRGRAPRSSMRARGAMTFAECPDPVSDRFAVTSKLPLRSWTRVTRSTNSIRGVDAQSIHTLFIGQPCDSPPRGRLLVWLKQRALPCRHAGADDSSRP